jgi:transposase
MGRVGGVPRMVSERYLGTAEDIAAAVEGATVEPERTRHLAFGAVAAVWGVLARLDVAGVVDDVIACQPSGLPLSVGTYLALATLNRVVDPCSKLGFASWWATTAADRFTKIGTRDLDHRRFWDAMRAVTTENLAQVEARVAARVIAEFGLDTSSVALDMTNFATYIHSANGKAPIAQRGKAKQKRADLRLVGLGLVVTRDGGIPLLSHAYPGNKPDVTQFPTMIDALCARHAGLPAGAQPNAEVTVVFDAGGNSVANFAHLAEAGLHYIGSVPASDCPDLLALPASRRRTVDADRFGGLTALDTRRSVYGQDRRAIVTHSPELHAAQARSFEHTTLAKACRKLEELAATLARGKTRRGRAQVEAEIAKITADTWVRRVITWHLTGDTPAEHRLSWHLDTTARTALEAEIFGKHVLITDHDDWPVAEVVAGYRSQSEAEFSFRQMKDPHVVSFSPMHHFTDHNIRVHTQTCVFALQIAHLMRRTAEQAGLHLSVRELLHQLAGIGETVLIYPSTGGRPKARRMTTETTPTQDQLAQIFQLDRYAPRT